MEDIDWSTFCRRISIKADKQVIYDHWISQDKLERWFLKKAEFVDTQGHIKGRTVSIDINDSYTWMWHGSDHVGEGEVLDINYKDYLKFTFLGCMVEVFIKTIDGEVLVELTQSDIPLNEASRLSHFVGCTRGWTFYLTNLKSILEGGIDLRNRNDRLNNVINT